jgi:hypothetical protein
VPLYGTEMFFFILKNLSTHTSRVADPQQSDVDTYRTLHVDADPISDLLLIHVNLRPMVYRPPTPPLRLHFEPLQLLNLDFGVDLDPAFNLMRIRIRLPKIMRIRIWIRNKIRVHPAVTGMSKKQCCGSAMASFQFRINLFTSMRIRIRIQGAKPNGIRIPYPCQSLQSLNAEFSHEKYI